MELYYRTKGISSNPPLIILHGLWGASDNWLTVAGYLEKYFYVILPDLRNHGNSPHAPQHDYEVLSEDIAAFIKQLNLLQKPFVAGHSMGGKVLMRLLEKEPEMMAQAAIIDIAPRPYPGDLQGMHQQLLSFLLSFPLVTVKSRQEIRMRIDDIFHDTKLQQLLLKNLKHTVSGFKWKINGQAIQNNIGTLLGWKMPVKVPIYSGKILFIKGEQSDYIERSDLLTIQKLFPHYSFTTIPHAGHWIHAEQPQLLAATLTSFFRQDSVISTQNTDLSK